jgi:Helix-turn-helix domain
MSPQHDRASELGGFLKARRAQIRPREAGLPEADSRRKVAGLRRDEVARLAAISVDYYTRLEQGRVHASASVLATLMGPSGHTERDIGPCAGDSVPVAAGG